MGYREVILRDRPTSYWRLGEQSTALDQIGTAPGLNQLAPVGTGLTYGFAGIPDGRDGGGGATHFDSTSYYKKSSPSGMVTGGAAGSMECWYYPDQAMTVSGSGGPLICFGKATNVNGGRQMLMQNISGTVYLFTDGANGSTNTTPPADAFPIPNRWNHMVLTFDGSGHMFYYLNGGPAHVASGVYTGTFTYNTDAADTLCIGTRSDTGTGIQLGGIDEAAVYNYQLTQEQIYAHWIAGRAHFSDRRRRGR